MIGWLQAKLTGKVAVRGYKVGEEIFRGPFSNVYRAVHLKSERPVALKILTPTGRKIAERVQREPQGLWEGELLEALDHLNIVKCIEHSGKRPDWLSLEYVEHELGNSVGPCRSPEHEDEVLRAAGQLASAVGYLHDKKIVHRDICLNNVRMTQDRVVKLIDFGLTVPLGAKGMTQRAGTPSYMAPEMIRSRAHTEGTDVYSLGVVIYELITGQKPFAGQLMEQRMTRSMNVDPPTPRRVGAYCSPELEALVMKALAKNPDDRMTSARQLDSSLYILRMKRGLA